MIFNLKVELYSRVLKEDIIRINLFLENHTLEKLKIKDNEREIIDSGSGVETILIFPGGLRKSYLSSFPYIDVLEKDYKIIAPSHPCLYKYLIPSMNGHFFGTKFIPPIPERK